MNIKYEDFIEQLNFKNEIGHGASGTVYKINIDKIEYAIKHINLKKLKDKQIEAIENETKILTKINHENIVKYYNSIKLDNSYFIIMEYCKYSDLDSFIKSKKKKDKKIFINNYVIYSILLEICLGIKEIHKNNIIHRDLKPENIFINKDYKLKLGILALQKK